MKISIIVPIYNGEKYIEKTVSLLLLQPYHNIELILVNDGSTDNSLDICKRFEEMDSRVIVINRENAGISIARNSGLEIATGDYISFIDQDDEIVLNIYNVLIEAIQNNDFVIAGKMTQLIDLSGTVIDKKEYVYKEKQIKNDIDILKLMLNSSRDSASLHLWNCLYRKEIIKDSHLLFNNHLKFGHEDTLFNIQYISCCRNIHIIDQIVYKYYRRKSTSTSLKKNEKYLKDFSEYSNEVCYSIFSHYTNESYKSMVYTYLFRLGINLMIQYGEDKKDLKSIVSICNEKTGVCKINKEAIDSKTYYYFLKIINDVILKEQYEIANWLIKAIKR